MRMLRPLSAIAVAIVVSLGTAQAQTKVTVGKIIGGSGFHIPSYVARDQGFWTCGEQKATAAFLHVFG